MSQTDVILTWKTRDKLNQHQNLWNGILRLGLHFSGGLVSTLRLDTMTHVVRDIIYTIVWFLRAPRWYIGPTAMPRAAKTPIATWSHNASWFYKLFACGSVSWGALIYFQLLFVSHDRVDRSSRLRADLRENPSKTMGITWCAHPISGKHF